MRRDGIIEQIKAVIFDNVLKKIKADKHQSLEIEIINSVVIKEDDIVDDFSSNAADKVASARSSKQLFDTTLKTGRFQTTTDWLNRSDIPEGDYDVTFQNAGQNMFGYNHFKFSVRYMNLGTEYIHVIETLDGRKFRRSGELNEYANFEEVISGGGGSNITDYLKKATYIFRDMSYLLDMIDPGSYGITLNDDTFHNETNFSLTVFYSSAESLTQEIRFNSGVKYYRVLNGESWREWTIEDTGAGKANQSTQTVTDPSTDSPKLADVYLSVNSGTANTANVATMAVKDRFGHQIDTWYATQEALSNISLTPGPAGDDAPPVTILYGELPVPIGPMWHPDVRELDVYVRFSVDGGVTYGDPLKFKGNDGAAGTDAPQVIFRYTQTGVTWHPTVEPDDMYMAISVDGGATYGYPMKFKGIDGLDGGTGIEALGYAMSDATSDITAGIKIPCAAIPYAFTVTAIRGQLGKPAIGFLKLTIDIKKNGNSILSTLLTFDSNETTSEGAEMPYALNYPTIALLTSDVVELSVTMAGGVDQAAQNLTLFLIGNKTI